VLSPDIPGHLLVHEAADADLLVVGSHGHGHGAVTGALLGSVSEYCTNHATCPVAVIRSERLAPLDALAGWRSAVLGGWLSAFSVSHLLPSPGHR